MTFVEFVGAGSEHEPPINTIKTSPKHLLARRSRMRLTLSARRGTRQFAHAIQMHSSTGALRRIIRRA
jgi:hypothetical protein